MSPAESSPARGIAFDGRIIPPGSYGAVLYRYRILQTGRHDRPDLYLLRIPAKVFFSVIDSGFNFQNLGKVDPRWPPTALARHQHLAI
jgi:hypothetical protein